MDRGLASNRGVREPVPWRTILASIAAVLAAVLVLDLLWQVRQVLAWLVAAVFFAVVLTPPVAWMQRHLRIRRGLAVTIVMLIGVVAIAGAGYVIVRPLISQLQHIDQTLPRFVDDAENGRGRFGHLAQQLHLDTWLRNHTDDIRHAATADGRPVKAARTVGNAAVAAITVFVLIVLLLLEGPDLISAGLGALPDRLRRRVEAVGGDAARAVTGYVAGNLFISVIAGLVTFVTLFALDVPFAGPLAVWVGVADLIPLVGATLGAIPAVSVALLHSTTAGVVTLVVYIVYQQFENHVLQVSIMAKTVALRPLLVLVAVLIGVELFGFLGALLAIPAAGVIQVIVRDLWDNRRGRPKAAATIGASETPVQLVDRDGHEPQPM